MIFPELQGPTLQVETGGPLPLSRKWNDWFSSLFHLWALEKQVSG